MWYYYSQAAKVNLLYESRVVGGMAWPRDDAFSWHDRVGGESAMEQIGRENQILQSTVRRQRNAFETFKKASCKQIEVLRHQLRELTEESKKQIEELRAELAEQRKANVELNVVLMKACEDIATVSGIDRVQSLLRSAQYSGFKR